jgi:hypothetical protein
MYRSNGSMQRQQRKPWTIMVYMAGGMDISEEARKCLLQMKEIGSTENFHLVAQFDSGTEGTSTKRYYLTPSPNALRVEQLLKTIRWNFDPFNSLLNLPYRAVSEVNASELLHLLTERQRICLNQRIATTEDNEKMRQNPNWMNTLILDSILFEDIDQNQGYLGQTNAGDPNVLSEFVKWAEENYPSNHKALIIWGHGDGLSVAWDYPLPPVAGVSDEEQRDSLTTAELGFAFSKARLNRKIDIIGFNSCLMGMLEVYYELKESAHYCVSSEGLTPRTGWPYYKILTDLNAKSGMAPKELAAKICDDYVSDYKELSGRTEKIRRQRRRVGKEPNLATMIEASLASGRTKSPDLGPEVILESIGLDISACELEKSTAVVEAMRSLVQYLQGNLEFGEKNHNHQMLSEILAAHSVCQSYFNADYVDLSDFCRTLSSFSGEPELRENCNRVERAIERMVFSQGHFGKAAQNSNGVSIFFPWGDWDDPDVVRNYKDIKFLMETGWHVFLMEYRKLVGRVQIAEAAIFAQAGRN